MREAEAVLTFGMSGWPVWVHHAHRDLHWQVLEIIEPEVRPGMTHNGPGRGGSARYLLKVYGPLAHVAGYEGTFYIAAERDGDRWWIRPDAGAYPRRGTPPGRLSRRRQDGAGEVGEDGQVREVLHGQVGVPAVLSRGRGTGQP